MKHPPVKRLATTLLALLCANLAVAAWAAQPPELQAGSKPAQTQGAYVYPKSIQLQYDIRGESKGFPYSANAELQWQNKGNAYEARSEISHFLLGSKVQTSVGLLTPQGLEPTRYAVTFRGEEVAHFERDKKMVTFSAKTPEAPLLTGAQDQVSVLLQIGTMLAAAPGNFPAGSTLTFQTVGGRTSETWTFIVGATEKLELPGGKISAIRLWRDPAGENEAKGEVWLAPSMDYLPVRIRATQAANDFVDQRWRATLKP